MVPKAGSKRRLTCINMIAWPDRSVNKKLENNTRRGRITSLFYCFYSFIEFKLNFVYSSFNVQVYYVMVGQ